MVSGAPIRCEIAPIIRLPSGNIPKNVNAIQLMTLPRICGAASIWTIVMAVDIGVIDPNPMINANGSAGTQCVIRENRISPAPTMTMVTSRTLRRSIPFLAEASRILPTNAPKPIQPAIYPYVVASPLKTTLAKTGSSVS